MVYATSDLHGYPLEKFIARLESAGFGEDDFLYVLGDVVDRGRDGIKIIKWLMRKRNAGLILGNHEAMLLACDFIFDELARKRLTGMQMRMYDLWMSNGGSPTLETLCATRDSEIKYIFDYLGAAPLYAAVNAGGREFILTHSGLGNFSPSKELEQYEKNELIWTRPKETDRYYENKLTVFGHTPTQLFGENIPLKTYLCSAMAAHRCC